MDESIIAGLRALTPEEEGILRGQGVDPTTYAAGDAFIINSAKLLEGKQLALRPHTRFVLFPEHGHDYMELMYVYEGSITHVIGGETITLERGDMLFLNRHARHSVLRAGQQDIGVNFILSNPFLQVVFHRVRNSPVMSEFLTENFDESGMPAYLYFRTKDNFPIRNLMDNLIYAVVKRTEEVYSDLVSLLFCYLALYRDTLANALRLPSPDAELRRSVLAYLERHYTDGTLSGLARSLGYAPAYLSRRVHALFGVPFRLLLQRRRMQEAEKLLVATSLSVEEIVRSVGYENTSHFHRLFLAEHGTTPHKYRKNAD